MTTSLQSPLQEWPVNCYDSGVPFVLRSDAEARRISRQGRSMAGNVTATKTATEERLYTIGEVSRLADLKAFVLRYWETEFPMLLPTKDEAGRRVYRQEDVDMVFRIKRLLYDERSEEHTSELQSQSNLVCRLLLEKKKKKTTRLH